MIIESFSNVFYVMYNTALMPSQLGTKGKGVRSPAALVPGATPLSLSRRGGYYDAT